MNVCEASCMYLPGRYVIHYVCTLVSCCAFGSCLLFLYLRSFFSSLQDAYRPYLSLSCTDVPSDPEILFCRHHIFELRI